MAKYPNINSVSYRPAPKDECSCCDNPATHVVRVEWDYMNGNDTFEPTCQRHAGIARQKPGMYFAHMRTKKSFVSKGSGQ